MTAEVSMWLCTGPRVTAVPFALTRCWCCLLREDGLSRPRAAHADGTAFRTADGPKRHVQEVALSRPALCEIILSARGHGDKNIDEF